ncbi:MAG TPA: S9 family peptidase [Wenzhouxiangella sp.]
MRIKLGFLLALIVTSPWAWGAKPTLQSADLFDLQYVRDVEISPDGRQIVYARAIHDIMCDCVRSNLWMVDVDGTDHQPLLSGRGSYSSPKFSPSGDRLAYVAKDEVGKTQLFVRWLASGQTAMITNLIESPSSIAWSPDGRSIAFSMRVPAEKPSLAKPPQKPEGATWAEPPVVIDAVVYRFDGRGYLKPGFNHIFVVPADGGAARQLTSGHYNHGGRLAWMADGSGIVFSANRDENWQYELSESDLYRVSMDGELNQLTDLPGRETSPTVSPDGQTIAFERDDHQDKQYSINALGLMDANGDNLRVIGQALDRSIESPNFSDDGESIYFHFTDRGWTKVGRMSLDGQTQTIIEGINGTTIGRPYTSGDYSVARDGTVAYTFGTEKTPADVWVKPVVGTTRQLTALNENLLGQRQLGDVQEIIYRSSVDGTEIQGWYLTPPNFDPDKKYPLILEIHGGPHLAYGPHFSSEMQRMAAEGYVVFYDNHRGSSGYGREFGMLLEYKYSSEEDFGDHMSGVDAMIDKGFIDPERLFIAGGSAGGIATAYAIGLTDRFKAAAVTKPVINWISKTLTGDYYPSQINHQFPGLPWDEFEHYWARSPLSLVGNVTTPTLLMTGEDDFRTPMSETEQYYQALKLQRVDAVMIRLPGTSHGIASRPSRLIAKIDNILAWFERYQPSE